MNNGENAGESQWPREVAITQSLDSIAADLGDDYQEDDDNGLVATAMIDSTRCIKIDSWDEIPKGYEPVDPEENAEYHAHLEAREKISTEGLSHTTPPPRPQDTVTAPELQCGRTYDCTVDSEAGLEAGTFVQLAIDPHSKRRFILMGTRHHLSMNNNSVQKLAKLSCEQLAEEYFNWRSHGVKGLWLLPFLLEDNGLTSESQDCYRYDFTELSPTNPSLGS